MVKVIFGALFYLYACSVIAKLFKGFVTILFVIVTYFDGHNIPNIGTHRRGFRKHCLYRRYIYEYEGRIKVSARI
jgi:hypothetical protein